MLSCIRFQLREYIDATKLLPEMLLLVLGLALINSNDSPDEAAALALFASYAISVVCCYRIVPRFAGSTRDLFALGLGRGKFEVSQLLAACTVALSISSILGAYLVFNANAELSLLLKIPVQGLFTCCLCAAAIFSSQSDMKSPLFPIIYGLAGFIYPVLGANFYLLGIVFASGDGFYLTKGAVILLSVYVIFKRSQTRDYISE